MAARGSWLSNGIVNTAACRRQEIGNCISVPTDFTLYFSSPSLSHSAFLSVSLLSIFLSHLPVLFSKQLRPHASCLMPYFDNLHLQVWHRTQTHLFLLLMNLFEASIWIIFNVEGSKVLFVLVIALKQTIKKQIGHCVVYQCCYSHEMEKNTDWLPLLPIAVIPEV